MHNLVVCAWMVTRREKEKEKESPNTVGDLRQRLMYLMHNHWIPNVVCTSLKTAEGYLALCLEVFVRVHANTAKATATAATVTATATSRATINDNNNKFVLPIDIEISQYELFESNAQCTLHTALLQSSVQCNHTLIHTHTVAKREREIHAWWRT